MDEEGKMVRRYKKTEEITTARQFTGSLTALLAY
jgi:hypothetical protein